MDLISASYVWLCISNKKKTTKGRTFRLADFLYYFLYKFFCEIVVILFLYFHFAVIHLYLCFTHLLKVSYVRKYECLAECMVKCMRSLLLLFGFLVAAVHNRLSSVCSLFTFAINWLCPYIRISVIFWVPSWNDVWIEPKKESVAYFAHLRNKKEIKENCLFFFRKANTRFKYTKKTSL